MFKIAATPINVAGLKEELTDPGAGACVCFEGWVRNTNEGAAVQALDYEAYEPVAVKEGEQVLAEARERFDLIDAACQHRVGALQLGDCAATSLMRSRTACRSGRRSTMPTATPAGLTVPSRLRTRPPLNQPSRAASSGRSTSQVASGISTSITLAAWARSRLRAP